ncbi:MULTISPECIES: hypothetical protein [Mesorhizobium]|uniref:hypothetical protein n=1 Tax=Mesorhizobium TaxID=68287 RepID=UPI000AF23183|nr:MULTISPECIES: hypothetical protein [Mesorhizobium]MDF3208443.1 hypothetical protein [Mesorhizobium sp. LMG15046]MDF3228986.1 hypothetical protein [Mesorhizobium sp. DSM 30133]RUU22104.1 hypothetical protein EOC84_03065 [Mesorhizobium sp. Primo-B]RUU37986.1 hypothetical protein EOC83_17150 [Mesorhizobium sp. Primo-A]RVB69048.1 hypothetical protein EN895_01790 [Mesorhizobium sp. M7A.F.Ca.CA.002.03.2.1]
MANKHTVATDALETLGTHPIPDNSGRDAIHLAVEPVVAGVRLRPGERVKIEKGCAVPARHDATGIVDPFLGGLVQSGQRFWFVVLPRTITSLRHVWSHPSFPEEATFHADADEHYVAPAPPNKETSEAWLREFVKNSDCPGYEAVMAAAVGDGAESWDDDYLHFNGQDAHGKIPPEFWDHVEVVTGQKITKRAIYFSCGC